MLDKTHPHVWQWDYLGMQPLVRELRSFVTGLPAQYRLLDIGCGSKPYKSLFTGATEYIGLDVYEGPTVDVVGKAWELPFPDNSFDVVISTQVLEHTEWVREAVSEIQRVAKPGAHIFISAPFAFPEHGAPYDYWRFTQFGLRSLFTQYTIDRIVPLQTYATALFRLWNAFVVNLAPRPLVEYVLAPYFLLNNLAARALDGVWQLAWAIVGRLQRGEALRKNVYSMPENYVIVVRNTKPQA